MRSDSSTIGRLVVVASTAVLSLLAPLGCAREGTTGRTPVDDSGASEPDAGTEEAGTTSACAARGGVCLPDGESAPPNRMPSAEPLCEAGDVCWVLVPTGTEACVTDVDCNEDVAISALHGACFEGVCVCKFGNVQPSGKCGPASPGDCAAHGGTCRQDPAECEASELRADLDTNTSCGDFAPALCCVPADKCKGPDDLVCCGAAADPYEPLCVNGWKTCGAAAPTPSTRQQGCH